MKLFCKAIFITLLLVGTTKISVSQVVSIRDCPIPPGDRYGLVRPGFRIMPALYVEGFAMETLLVLKMDIKLSGPQNPTGAFSYRYLCDGEEFNDEDPGFDPQKIFPDLNSNT